MTPTETKPRQLPMTPERRQWQREREKLLAQLIYETDTSGKPIYFKGYRRALNGILEPEDIMGSSTLQSFLVNVILEFLYTHPQKKQFSVFSSEFGLQMGRKKWRACDIAVYYRKRLKGFVYTNKYMNLPPDFVIEIDTKADLSRYKHQQDYFLEKTRQLHEFGVKKVIWIFTESIPVIWESNAGEAITIHQNWDVDLTVTEGVIFNLARLVEAEEEE